jgi:type I restriction enzyme S subunit
LQLEDSPLGQFPEGWGLKLATDIIDFAPKMSLPKYGVKPFVAMPSISTSSMIIGDIEMRAGNSGTKFMNGDTLMARITPCLQNGKIGFVQFLDETNPIGFGSTEFIVMRSKDLTPEFVYCLARSDTFKGNAINSMAGADGRQRVKNDCFNSYYLAVPPKDILDQFSALAEPAFKEIFTLGQKNKNLRKQRDMLLPKLISGKINLNE